MNKRKLFQKNGITLIALVISIIVMLILAGVSLNAVIGDNGIITQAQTATYMQSIAVLEEYLNNYYVEHYEEMKDAESKVVALSNMEPNWFYIPANEGIGNLRYISDSDGNALFLIKKENLPEDIKGEIRGGDAGEGSYADYANLNDVYGITSNLKVYYCKSGSSSILGISKEDLDKDNPLRIVFNADSQMAQLLSKNDINGDGILTADEIKSVKTLTIDSSNQINSLEELYNLTSLQELKLKDITLENLNGIQNVSQINYIYFENCKINDYSKIGDLKEKLKTLIFYNTTDNEIEKLCSIDNGIAKAELSGLENLAIVGNVEYIGSNATNYGAQGSSKSTNTITNVKPLKNLTNSTKQAVKKLSLQCNNITSVEGIEDFVNIELIRLEFNKIETLAELKNMNNLKYIRANDNNLGVNEVYDVEIEEYGKSENDALKSLENKEKITFLSLANNKIRWIDYIVNNSNYQQLYLLGNTNFVIASVSKIGEVYAKPNSTYKNIDSKFENYLNTSEIIKYVNMNLTDSSEEITYLLALSDEEKAKVKTLSLKGNSELSNDKLVELLSEFPNLIALDVGGCTNLTSLSFLNNMKSLQQFYFSNTGITGTEVAALENCTNIKGIECNNPNIDLTVMQKTLSRIDSTQSKYYTVTGHIGMGIKNSTLMKQIENCTEITNFRNINATMPSSLDLSKCTKLTTVKFNSSNQNIILPTSVKTIHDYSTIDIDFAGETNLTHYETHGAPTSIESKLEMIVNAINDVNGSINKVVLKINSNNKYVDVFKYLSKISISEITIDHYYDGQTYGIENFSTYIGECNSLTNINIKNCFSIGSISGLENLSNLQYLRIERADISDLTPISNLNSLKELRLSGNQISNVSPLKDLRNLQALDLSNNCLDNNSDYLNDNGETIRESTLSIIANLHTSNNGQLNLLYLAGNTGITNFDTVSKLKWNDKSGF